MDIVKMSSHSLKVRSYKQIYSYLVQFGLEMYRLVLPKHLRFNFVLTVGSFSARMSPKSPVPTRSTLCLT